MTDMVSESGNRISPNPYSLSTIDAETLMACHFTPKSFIVDRLLACGLALLCGRPKTGKSWLVMNLCLSVAQGKPFLNHETKKCDVLYLALEDPMLRIQERLGKLSEDCPPNLRFCNQAGTLGGCLKDQLLAHLSAFPETRLIVIDTLQKIRGGADDKSSQSSYSADYAAMAELKKLADERDICILLVHHLRKLRDREDPFNEISGSSGLMGAADSALVLMRQYRGSDGAYLFATGRDFQDMTMALDFSDGKWDLIGEDAGTPHDDVPDPFSIEVINWINEHGAFEGTASELLKLIGFSDCRPNVFTRYLGGEGYNILKKAGIEYRTGRSNKGRWIRLTPIPPKSDDTAGNETYDDSDASDANDANDDCAEPSQDTSPASEPDANDVSDASDANDACAETSSDASPDSEPNVKETLPEQAILQDKAPSSVIRSFEDYVSLYVRA